ncbi:MAG: small GTP-binding protein [Candidatus Entotheonella factor]|uniref:Small GTP-binding protein n=1 Tax=Entotheonella factor TaxID=1429438 RepID=W4LZ22_ENTF1|nr:Rab family GTPase [Candidatus Entotheonella palauensis]ETX03319.1 MAG: small GTP-binding protein [Candidatus Entotheonella factor]
MLRKKICMLGAFAVGKTSLVARCVSSVFSEKYHTTVGVKVDTKHLAVGGQELNLVLWDLAGEDEFHQVRMSYLRGASGYLLVVDSTRPTTLDTAVDLQRRVADSVGDIPFLVLFNKADLVASWEVDDTAIAMQGWPLMKTSAKTGDGVEEAFTRLAQMMV